LRSVTFDSFSQSNSISPNHSENQDSYLVDQENLLSAVADGVGGYSGAKEASSLAIELLGGGATGIIDEKSLVNSLSEIHKAILKRAGTLHFQNMGTTIAIAKVFPGDRQLLVGNVGDSPILLLREDSLDFIHVDDSQRSSNPLSMYGIIQYLGLDCKLDIHVRTLQTEPGDVLLLCSDGITDNLLNSRYAKEKLVSLVKLRSAEKIVDSAIKEGLKPDDMTAVLVFL
jgi:PPM family protein phosphatase